MTNLSELATKIKNNTAEPRDIEDFVSKKGSEQITQSIDKSNATLLHYAAACGNHEAITALLKYNPWPIDQKNSINETASQIAHDYGFTKIYNALEEYKKSKTQDEQNAQDLSSADTELGSSDEEYLADQAPQVEFDQDFKNYVNQCITNTNGPYNYEPFQGIMWESPWIQIGEDAVEEKINPYTHNSLTQEEYDSKRKGNLESKGDELLEKFRAQLKIGAFRNLQDQDRRNLIASKITNHITETINGKNPIIVKNAKKNIENAMIGFINHNQQISDKPSVNVSGVSQGKPTGDLDKTR